MLEALEITGGSELDEIEAKVSVGEVLDGRLDVVNEMVVDGLVEVVVTELVSVLDGSELVVLDADGLASLDGVVVDFVLSWEATAGVLLLADICTGNVICCVPAGAMLGHNAATPFPAKNRPMRVDGSAAVP